MNRRRLDHFDRREAIVLSFILIVLLIAIAANIAETERALHTPPKLAEDLEWTVQDCAQRNTFAVTPAPALYTNASGLTTCLWLNGVTVSRSTLVPVKGS